MTNEITKNNAGETVSVNQKSVQGVLKDVNITKMLHERLGKKAGPIVTSALSIVNNNKLLQNVSNPMTVVQAVLTAGNLDLPLNPNLGFAYIVPYKGDAQFQMGWKGFVQLAQRSGKFKTINTTDVREGEITNRNRMTGELEFAWTDDDNERNSKPVIGYLAYFELLNGFSKSLYMSRADVEHHAGRFSQAYKANGQTPWKTDFDAMAQKTVLKQLLSKYAPLSTEMEQAIAADQSVDDGTGTKYPDNDPMADVENSAAEEDEIIAAHAEPEAPAKSKVAEAEVVEKPEKAKTFKERQAEFNKNVKAKDESDNN